MDTFKIIETGEEVEVESLHVTTSYSDEPDSPFHHAFQAQSEKAICLDTDEEIAFRAHTVDGEWYFVKAY